MLRVKIKIVDFLKHLNEKKQRQIIWILSFCTLYAVVLSQELKAV